MQGGRETVLWTVLYKGTVCLGQGDYRTEDCLAKETAWPRGVSAALDCLGQGYCFGARRLWGQGDC